MAANGTGWRSADNSDTSRPATEVDYLFNVQVTVFCRLRSVSRNYSLNNEPKVDERFPSARIFANLPVVCIPFVWLKAELRKNFFYHFVCPLYAPKSIIIFSVLYSSMSYEKLHFVIVG